MKKIQSKITMFQTHLMRSIGLLLVLLAVHSVQAQTLPQAQEEMLEELTQLLRDNPEVIGQLRDSVRDYSERQNKGAQQLEQHRSWLQDTERHPAMGASEPELTLVVFNDYNCPYCKRQEPVLQQLLAEYPQLRVVHILLPLRQQELEGIDTNATLYAMNVWRNAPERFEAVHEMLMDKSGMHNARSLKQIGAATDTEQWLDTDRALVGEVQQALQVFRDLGLRGTPSLVVGEQVAPGFLTYDRLKPLVEQALSEGQ